MSSPRFVTAAVDHFYDTGEWPTVRLLQNVLTELEDQADARREAKRLPYGHGHREDNLVVLSVRGIFDAEPNHVLLKDFEDALGVAIQCYRRGARREEATISYRTLIDRCAFREDQAKRAITLLEVESLLSDAGLGADIKVIQPRIRFFLRVRDVADYVRKRTAIDRCSRVKRLVGKLPEALHWFFKEKPAIIDLIIVAALGALLAGVLLAATLGGSGSDASGGSNRRPEGGPGRHASDHQYQHRRSAAARSGG